jgi:membrane protein implicated in regulation of membrane protease activity
VQLLSFLVASANGPFTVSIGIAVVFFLIQASGLLSMLSGDGDHDGDADGGDADGDHDGDHDGDTDGEHESGLTDRILGPLGVGKIPLSFIWQSFLVVFGVTGLALNSGNMGKDIPLFSLVWTLPVSGVVAFGVVALMARLLSPVLSSKGQEATHLSELNGLEGVVISTQVTQDFGEVRLKDRSGHVLRLVCRLEPGLPAVGEGQSVVVVGRNGAYLRVIPLELGEPRTLSQALPVKDREKA